MMRFAIILLSLTLSVFFVSPVFAQSSKTRQITGYVISINRANNTVTVRKKNKEVVLSIEDKTRIIQCTQKSTIADIKIGDRVTVRYKEAKEGNSAKSVIIKETLDKQD